MAFHYISGQISHPKLNTRVFVTHLSLLMHTNAAGGNKLVDCFGPISEIFCIPRIRVARNVAFPHGREGRNKISSPRANKTPAPRAEGPRAVFCLSRGLGKLFLARAPMRNRHSYMGFHEDYLSCVGLGIHSQPVMCRARNVFLARHLCWARNTFPARHVSG